MNGILGASSWYNRFAEKTELLTFEKFLDTQG